jgi:hypothetical protein
MNLDYLLRESVNRYRSLLHLQWEVNEMLKGSLPTEIEAYAEHLEERQRQVMTVDLALWPLLRQEGAAVAANPLFRERQALLEESARQIGLLLPAAAAGKAMVAADLLQIKEGRTAMAGYESGGRERGNMVSGQV